MKQLLSVVLIFSVLLTSCADSLTYIDKDGNSVTAESTGVFNKSKQDPNCNYEIIPGNIVWSVLLCETFIAPLYFVGWSIMEPVSVKQQVINVVPADTLPTRKDSLREQAAAQQAEVFETVEAHVDAAGQTFFGTNE